jgi:hypothetical protein
MQTVKLQKKAAINTYSSLSIITGSAIMADPD